MMSKSLRYFVEEANKSGRAIGHFNFSTAEMLRGIVDGAKESNVPVIVGVSEGERDFFGIKQSRAIVSAFRDDFNIPIFLNADHTKSVDRAKEAIDAGFDALVMDASAMTFLDNIKSVKEVVEYAKQSGRDVLIEGELGFIGTSSKVLDEIPPGVPLTEAEMTNVEEAKRLANESGLDMFAPAVGNLHGVVRGGVNPALSINKIVELKKACNNIPLVLHGASGISESDVRKAVKAGMAVVHFSTDLRFAYRKSLANSLAIDVDEISPYKYMRDSIKSVKEVVKTKISWLQ